MFSGDGYLGAPGGVESLRSLNEKLSAQVVAQVSSTQELVTMNKFEHECNEYLFKKSLEERISDVESWRWVLEDLSKRLEAALEALRYEHNALRVVVQRVREELETRSREASRPGALTPQSDSVEEAISQEYDFLREQRKRFQEMIDELNKNILAVTKVKNRIEDAALDKQQAIKVDEKCSNIALETAGTFRKKKKKSQAPINRWENRCISMKKKGLCALSHALLVRQQVRGARSQLSVAAQSFAARVDSTLRKRLHANKSKLQELHWQRGEAISDFNLLSEELLNSERNTLETMEKIRLMEARLADRTFRPPKEVIRDEVDRKLKDELNRLKRYLKSLRDNIDRINSLQKDLTASIAKINCVEEDLSQVVRLDEDRTRGRCDDVESEQFMTVTNYDSRQSRSSTSCNSNESRASVKVDGSLSTITEDDEDDDYPLDY